MILVAFGHLTDQCYIIFIAVIYSFKLQLRVWYFKWVRGSAYPSRASAPLDV